MRKTCVICDVDKVIVDSREWEKHAPKDVKDRLGWKNFLEHSTLAKPNKEMRKLMLTLNGIFPIIFVTSRENYDNAKMITQKHIKEFSHGKILVGPWYKNKLFMRSKDDFRSPAEVKEEILRKKILPFYAPVLAIDDDIENIKMFKKYGIYTYHYKGLLK